MTEYEKLVKDFGEVLSNAELAASQAELYRGLLKKREAEVLSSKEKARALHLRLVRMVYENFAIQGTQS